MAEKEGRQRTAREMAEDFAKRKADEGVAEKRGPEPLPDSVNRAAHAVVDAAFAVHWNLRPGLMETVYETCLVHELTKRGLKFARQVEVSVNYDGARLDAALRADLIVADDVLVELKAVESLLPVHSAQMLTYLKLTGCRLGLLINFNVPLIRDGIKRLVR